jgi:hypothetical protein
VNKDTSSATRYGAPGEAFGLEAGPKSIGEPGAAGGSGAFAMGRASGESFGWALSVLKSFPGARVARKGWNGKGMWLALVKPGLGAPMCFVDESDGGLLRALPWIGMRTADGCFVPWLASQTDMLVEDWVEVAS